MTSGLTTIVFVDVEASTSLVDRVGDHSGVAAVQAQLEAVRERVVPYGGREVKSLGDGLLLTFDSPRSAIAFSLAALRALGGSEPRIKIGVNTGEVIDADGDPLGGAVNAAARIGAKAKGGEVLVSEVVRQLVGSVPGTSFVDRGRCRLKGFSERWHLYAATDGSAPSALVTVGRATESVMIEELVRNAVSGAGQLLLLEGEAGIGKTHLARLAAETARRRSMRVMEGRTDELDGRPGALVRSLIDHLPADAPARHRIVDLLASRASTDDAVDLGYALIEATVELVDGLAVAGPTLVVAEDLHWGDELSLRALAAVAKRVSSLPVLLVMTCRPAPRPALLDRVIELVGAEGGRHIGVEALDEVAVCALASAHTGAAPSNGLLRRLDATSGNPLFVTELLRALEDDGALRVAAGVVEVGGEGLPTSLRQTVVRRLSWLAAATVDLLRLASLLGGSFTMRDLAAVSGRSIVDVAAGLQEATRAAIVVGDGDRLSFRHDLLREAIYEDIDPAVRRDLHRAAGQALAAVSAPAMQVAHQLSLGARVGDADAIEWLERAAQEALAYSPAIAISLLEQALALAPPVWPDRHRVEVELIEPLAGCGRHAEAEAVARAVLGASPPADIEYRALQGLAAVLGLRGSFAESVDTLLAAADARGASPREALLNRCLVAELRVISGTGDRQANVAIAREALDEAEASRDDVLRCLALQTLGIAASIDGHDDDALAFTKGAAELVASGRVGWHSYLAGEEFHTMVLVGADRIDEALAVATSALARAERAGATSAIPLAAFAVGGSHFYAGRWDEAVPTLETCVAISEDIDNRAFLLYVHAMLASIALHRGDRVTATHWFDVAEAYIAAGNSPAGIQWFMSARAFELEIAADVSRARAMAELGWQAMAPLRYMFGYRQHGTQLVRLAIADGADDLAREVTAIIEEGARRSSAVSAQAAATQCRGLLERDGDALTAAARLFAGTPLLLQRARSCEDAGLALAGQRRDEAVTLMEDAAAGYLHLGAVTDLNRVDASLRAIGVRRRRAQPARPTTGLDSLTNMERQVAMLVAEGLTNPVIGARLYISRRTVETHLSHIFTKCGLSSRAQLAAEVVRQGST